MPTAPDGFTAAESVANSTEWTTLATNTGGCAINALAGMSADVTGTDLAADTEALLSQLASGQGATPGAATEATYTWGAPSDQNQPTAVSFLESAWQADGSSAQTAAVVGASLDYQGSLTKPYVAIQLSCPGPIDEAMWQKTMESVRPDIGLAGTVPDDQWTGIEIPASS